MDHPDHYATLGVPRDATAKQIRDAYRKLARQHHPDLHPGDTSGGEILKRVNEAYEVLSDADKRRKYNMLGADWSGILRDEDQLRREAGFAPVAEAAARPAARSGHRPRVYRDRTDSYLILANSARAAIAGLVIAAVALIAPYARQSRGDKVHARPTAQFQEAAAAMRDLSLVLNQFAQILDEGVGCWKQVCLERSVQTDAFLDRTVKPNYERRYREDAQAVIAQITRAESAGAFALPLAASDQAVLRSIVSLRDELLASTGTSPLDCRNDLPLHQFKALANQVAAGRRCFEQLSQIALDKLAVEGNAGRNLCKHQEPRARRRSLPALGVWLPLIPAARRWASGLPTGSTGGR